MEKEKEKVNIFKSIKKTDIAIIIVALAIVVYIFFQAYGALRVELQTQSAEISQVYDTVEAYGLVVRNETTVKTSSTGITQPCVDSGEKVKTDGNVAMVFSSNENSDNYYKLRQLNDQVKYYEELQAKSVSISADIESVDNEIIGDVNSYIRSCYSNDNKLVDENVKSLNGAFIKRQLVIGEDIDFTGILQDLRKNVDSISSSTSTPESYITTDKSGVFSTAIDGYENIVDYDKIDDITANKVSDLIESCNKGEAKDDTSNCIGKLVNEFTWYILMPVSKDDASGLEEGTYIKLTVESDSNRVIRGYLKSIKPNSSNDKVLLTIRCNELDADIMTERVENIQIRKEKYEGVKVPIDAVHVVDGKKGVYVMISSKVVFREADIVYTGEDYVILSFDPANEKGIRLYDEIITKGKSLEDGKVYT